MQTLPFSNAGSTAWKVRRPQGWVFTTTVVQFGASCYHALSSIRRQRGCLGLPGLCGSAAAMPSLSSRLWLLRKRPFSCSLHHQSGPSITSLSSFIRGSLLFLKQVLRLQRPLKPLETLAKIFLGPCLGYSDSVRRGASLRNLQLMISVPLPLGRAQEQRHKSIHLSALAKTWSRCSSSLEPKQFTKQGFYTLF